MSDRELETRDSVILKSLVATRKGRGDPHPSSLSVSKVTPWGVDVGPDADAEAVVEERVVTTAHNHFQNEEAFDTDRGYRVPDISPAHNHFQNLETDQKDSRLKLSSSRINDGEFALGPTTSSPTPRTSLSGSSPPPCRLKMAYSKINEGNDIFGGPTSPSRVPPSREEPFKDRLSRGAIRTHNSLVGYTDAANKF